MEWTMYLLREPTIDVAHFVQWPVLQSAPRKKRIRKDILRQCQFQGRN
jgi:hypothetical protein